MAATAGPWLSASTARNILTFFRYLSPAVLFVVYLVVFVTRSVLITRRAREKKAKARQLRRDKARSRANSPFPKDRTDSTVSTVSTDSSPLDFSPGRRAFFTVASVLLLLTFIANGTIVTVHALMFSEGKYWCGQAYVIYVLATLFFHTLALISLIDSRPSPNILQAAIWTVSLLIEVILLGASCALYSTLHREGQAFDPLGGRLLNGFSIWETFEVLTDICRVFILALLSFTYGYFIYQLHLQETAHQSLEHGFSNERTSLLKHHTGNGYASDQHNNQAKKVDILDEPAGWVRPNKLPPVTWWQYVSNYSLFFKYLWPAHSRQLQWSFFFCVLLLIAGRGVNVLVPYQAGKIVHLLSDGEGRKLDRILGSIILFVSLRFLQGSSGLLHSARAYLWIPIGQYSYRELALAIFEHVHTLSLEFHMNKKTGEVISAMNKGGSINTFLDQITFQVGPMMVDLIFAMAYFVYAFDIYYALIVALMSLAYMSITVRLAQWRADIKREVTNLDRVEDAVKTDSITLFEVVKYYNAELFENSRYRDVVTLYQEKELALSRSLNFMNVVQNTCFSVGLLLVCFLAAFQIHLGQRNVGEFVVLLTYMSQLQQPLNFFGTFYRSIQSAMINAERILELFKEEPTVFDDESARPMASCDGGIRFKNVKFSYDPRKQALTGMNFECPPGTRTALVGASGVGKSTVFRLLFRFYNADEGNIEIDGKDVKDITIESLRSFIGIVPQDTPLFHETIMYNVKYARQDATDEEVFEACRAASIHDKILEFPDGYNSAVGDRGVKLSGGERQRIAIARSMLKNPRILLLDEATASLDGDTEQKIQDSIDEISRGRTSIVIAHRLSTIIQADQILVMHEGQVVEYGTHEELLALDQRYTRMWKRHIRAERAELQALAMQQKANKLNQVAKGMDGDSSAYQSEDDGRPSPRRRVTNTSLQMTKLDQVNSRLI